MEVLNWEIIMDIVHFMVYIQMLAASTLDMTREVRYIMENRRFKRTWDDYLCYWEFLVPILIFVIAIELSFRGSKIQDYLISLILIVVSAMLTRFAALRNRQLNEFEEITNKLSQADNFYVVLEGLKKLNVIEIDKDFHNWTINAKCKSKSLPPVEWLTIVCLDNRVLINSRPTPTTILFWFRRAAMIDIRRFV
jgi:hypothetical protein